jgi:hypothetical protein
MNGRFSILFRLHIEPILTVCDRRANTLHRTAAEASKILSYMLYNNLPSPPPLVPIPNPPLRNSLRRSGRSRIPDPPTSMAAEGEKKMITLKSSDGEEFEVEEAVAMESQTIRHMIEDDCADNGIPLPNVNSKILSKVIEYCNKHVHAAAAAAKAGADDAGANNSSAPTTAASGEDLKNWDADFVKVDQATLFDLILVRALTPLSSRCLPAHGGKIEILDLGLVTVRMVLADLDLFVAESGFLCADCCA